MSEDNGNFNKVDETVWRQNDELEHAIAMKTTNPDGYDRLSPLVKMSCGYIHDREGKAPRRRTRQDPYAAGWGDVEDRFKKAAT